MGLSVVTSLPDPIWRRFVNEQPFGNIYHTPEMFEVFARTHRHRPTLWATLEGEEPRALLMPVQVTLINGLLRPFTTRAICYGSVCAVPDSAGERGLTTLFEEYVRQAGSAPLYTELRHIRDATPFQPQLAEYGFVREGHLNYQIDLTQPEASLWRKLSKSCQQSIRTSRNKGLVIDDVSDPARLSEAYALLKTVYERAQVPLAHTSLFEAAFAVLVPKGMLKLFLARVETRCIGVCMLLAFRERVIYWYGGLDRNWAAYSPMEALLWQALQWSQAQGYKIFDMGGCGKPNEDYGPRKFKAKFGGELVEPGRSIHIPSRFRYRLSETGYQILRRFL